ncbi:MAG: hypothetical protein AUK44_03665 [Porphyromonadaceae bacterium CG2_30_38_12]|nr:MAG: hypothetical protein AUK44_03665 [Porphyromonadaceae bacterium CG2_30_38_12]
MGELITSMVDFFYPPFRKYISLRLFRYAITGAGNLVLDWVLYFVIFHFVLNQQMLHLVIVTLSSHIAAMFLVFPITFTTGFFLQKYVTFSASELKGRVQLVRYLSVVAANLIINYFGLKLLVDFLHVYPTPSKMLVTFVTVIFSYVSQKRFTFRIPKQPAKTAL